MNAHFRSACRLAMALTLTSSVFANDALSDAWALLKQENADLASQQKVVESEQAQLENAKDLRQPTVSLASQYNVMNDDITLSMDLSAYGLGNLDYEVQDQTFWNTELTVTMPLYTGGQISAGIDSAQADIAESTAKKQQIEDALFTTFVRRYLGVELAQQNLATRKLALDNLQKHLERAIRMEQEGSIAHTQRLQSEVERDKARREWQQAADDYELALSAYQAMFKSDAIAPAQRLVYVDIPLPEKHRISDMVLSRSPILAQISANQDKANAGVKATEGAMKPTVALFGLMELAKDDLTALEPEWVVGASLQWKLYGGGNRSATKLSYLALSESADLKAQQVRRDLTLYATQAVLSLESAENSYLSLQSSKELADENLRLQQKAFIQGVSTALDEVDAHLLVTGIQLESHKALYDYYTALADLAALTGEIDRFLQFMQDMPGFTDGVNP
ncbi:TolC family protein [Reinekea marinisedimentorum]|uniref:Outer membrane protein TolC n=1 Tax=Reinekea marinisedimentorum TaxID=230495 RepID=A0A4R3HZQ4_9GAMM|nr:TolC family protein [Reinekea marinisedimentorum]TCS38738.1 outer membrane protein TolC [Reinekea marinisedimentorum]